MNANQPAPNDIDEYIAAFPAEVQALLEQVRRTISAAAPDAQETISYRMPTFTLNGRYLVYFAAYKKHIGFYPAPIGQAEFVDDLAAYESGKGTLKFPLHAPMPLDLIGRIVTFRVAENLEKAAAKTSK
jgi:uncharacterized protein YdhG (YjbR/CyaY superfamily)